MTRIAPVLLLALATACAAPGSAPEPAPTVAAGGIDSARVMRDLGVLAHDSMAGRVAATPSGARARRFLLAEYARIGLRPLGASHEHAFTYSGRRDTTTRTGVNVIGYLRGTERPDRYIVVSAHYDHVAGPAVNGDSIYNGADDDASGTAAVLEFARWFAANPPRTSMIFALFDAEESGLRGSRAWVQAPPVPLDSIDVAMTMDMVSHNDQNELVAAGTNPYPFLKPYVERVAAGAPVRIRYGHDTPDLPPGDEWLSRTDAGPFHVAKVPALLFSVADHADYHKPSDEVESITPGFYVGAMRTMLATLRAMDVDGAAIAAQRTGAAR
jgi:Zn-dependent M28 family amino/carboxypeptidase